MRPDALCGPSWIERPLRTNPAARTRAVRCTDGRERRFSPTPFPESFPVVSETSPALTTLNIDMVQALALAVLAYYGGSAIITNTAASAGLPQTGDAQTPYIGAGLVLAAMAIVVIIAGKKRN